MENQAQSIQPQMPAQPAKPKIEPKKKLPKLKLAALIIFVFLILTLPFDVYLALRQFGIHPKPSTVTIKTMAPTTTSIPDPTATWKTYTNNYLGFSIKYASDWSAPADNSDNGYAVPTTGVFYSPEAVNYQNTHPQNMGMPDGNIIIYSYYHNYRETVDPTETSNGTTPLVIASGQKGTYSTITNTLDKSQVEERFIVRFESGTILFTFQSFYPDGPKDIENIINRNKETFKQMLKTLKFIDQASKFCPANGMNFFDALDIAIKDCTKNGQLGLLLNEKHTCNPNGTGYWWIDFKPNEPKSGCNPTCVVDVTNKTANINWRCTGLILPKQ